MTRTVINHRYEIIRNLGVGGMSAVFEAQDLHLKRRVALKVLRIGDSLQSEESDEKDKIKKFFKREARALARLNHPSIPTVYDYSDDSHDPAYIALELIDGMTLHEVTQTKKLVPIPVILGILQRVAEALDHAHQSELIHRDIKPENIMLTHTGRTLLMDFGMTRGVTANILGKTVSGGQSGIFGSLEFLSPEQIADEPVGTASDIFSFGSMAFLLSTGQSAFNHKNPAQLMRQILDSSYEPPQTVRSDIPGGLHKLIERCLNRDAAARPKAAEIASRLDDAMRKHWRSSPEDQIEAWLKKTSPQESPDDLAIAPSTNMTESGE